MIPSRQGFRFIRMAAALLLLAACTTTQPRQTDLEVSDSWINTRVQNEIGQLIDERSQVQVRTEDGVVFLDGHVRSISEVERIEATTSRVRGVREVKNSLVVRP